MRPVSCAIATIMVMIEGINILIGKTSCIFLDQISVIVLSEGANINREYALRQRFQAILKIEGKGKSGHRIYAQYFISFLLPQFSIIKLGN